MTRARYAWKPVAWIALWALLVSMLTFVATPAHAAETPTGLKVVNTSARGFAVTWKAVPGAVGYRVRISKSSSMSNAAGAVVDTNFVEWTQMDGNPTHKAARLSPGTRYYVQVRVLDENKGNLSGYSAKLEVTTKSAKSLPELSPSLLKGTPASGSALYLSWTSQGPGMLYRVRYGTNPSLTDANSTTKVFTAAGGTLTGLKPSTTYYFKVRALDANKSNLSSYSPVASAKTATAKAVPGLVVASYNVLKPPTWEKRRKALVANIKAQAPDILGIQEATPAKVKSAKNGKSVKQHDDLLYLLGSKYRYATTTNSEGTRLAYNTARLTLVKSGAQKLTTVGKYSRYAVWAILKDKIGGRQVFAVNTHLEPPSGGNANKNIWNARKKQANQIMDLIAKQNTGKLPVVLTGDLNSSRANKPSNGVYREFLERGLVDPLGDADDTWFRITPGIAEHEIGVEYNSFNNLERKARRTAYGVGTHVDYILVSKGVRVAKVQTVVSLDRNGKFKGTIPSDHNLITTTIHVG